MTGLRQRSSWASCRLVFPALLVMAVEGSAFAQPLSGGSRTGHVAFITGRRAYLDRGALDGLIEGQLLQLTRGGRPAARCAVERVADRAAICSGPGVRVGDRFRVARPRARPALMERALAPPTEPAVLAERAHRIAEASFPKVEFVARDRHGIAPGVSATIGLQGWSGNGSDLAAGGFLAETVDGTIQRLAVGETDFRFALSFTALRWQLRPDAVRFEPGRRTQFFLWEAEVSRRELDDRTVLAVGRLWPWHLPGLAMLDGLQVGRRTADGSAEVGLYLGTSPTADGLDPTLANWAGGAYAALVHAAARRAGAPAATLELRVGARHSPSVGQVRDAELLGQAWSGPWAGAGGVRASQSVDGNGARRLEQAHLQVGLRPGGRFAGWLQARYLGPTADEASVLRDQFQSGNGAYHAALTARYDLSPRVGLSFLADGHQERGPAVRSLDETFEVRFPRLFSDAGGLWLAATGTEGWVRGRGGYVQYWGAPLFGARVLARVVVRATQFAVPVANAGGTEVGGALQIDQAVGGNLRLRARSALAVPLSVQDQPPLPPRANYQVGIDVIAAY